MNFQELIIRMQFHIAALRLAELDLIEAQVRVDKGYLGNTAAQRDVVTRHKLAIREIGHRLSQVQS